MNDYLKKLKTRPASLLDNSPLLSEKDSINLIKAKDQKNECLKQTDTNFEPKQAGRDWWWCDDV